MKRRSLLFIIPLFLLSACDRSETNWGEDFFGEWQHKGPNGFKINIEPLVREGKVIENRYWISITESKRELPKGYMQEGQYNYWYVTADPEFNHHPFKEFIHKNSFADTITYIKMKDENTLIRRYKGWPDIYIRRVPTEKTSEE